MQQASIGFAPHHMLLLQYYYRDLILLDIYLLSQLSWYHLTYDSFKDMYIYIYRKAFSNDVVCVYIILRVPLSL